jgi:hypothetical protein
MATPALRWVGSWSTPRAVLVLLGAALLGLIGTVVIRRDPGFLIGFLLIVGSVVAATGARRAVHRLIPLPALCYITVTFIAGYLHDRANVTTSKEFYTSFLSWVGSAFFALVWATVLVVVIAFCRWLMSKRLVSGTLPAASSGPGRTASGSSGSDPWGDQDSRGAVNSRAAPDSRDALGTGSFRDSRGPRDSRDPWGQRDSRGTAFGDPRGDRGGRGDSGSWDGPARPGGASRTGGNRGQYDGRDRDANDPWGTSAEGDTSWTSRPTRNARVSRDGRALHDDRDSLDGRDARDKQSQRGYDDPRDDDRARDNRRPRPADGPRDLW